MLTASTFRDWFRERFRRMFAVVCGQPPSLAVDGVRTTFRCRIDAPVPDTAPVAADLPTDDWPFVYMVERAVPPAYAAVALSLALLSAWWLWRGGLSRLAFTRVNAHMFLLGAAFLLMEVTAINRLALLFGTTWLVSALAISFVLVLILAANLVVGAVRADLRRPAYLCLAATLAGVWGLDPAAALGTALAIPAALFVVSPVFFAGIVFATTLRESGQPAQAIGANILGAAIGGWVEYTTMATGMAAMALVALCFYAASAWALGPALLRR